MDILKEPEADTATTTYRWTGVLGLIGLASTEPHHTHRLLSLPPMGDIRDRLLPPPLLAPGQPAHQVGRIFRLWRCGEYIQACGEIDVDPDTPWGQRLLTGTPQPIDIDLVIGSAVTRNQRWWHPLLRAAGADRPRIEVIHDWSVRSAVLGDIAEWPDAFITLDALEDR